MREKKILNIGIFFIVSSLALLYFFMNTKIIPGYFKWDARTIQFHMQNANVKNLAILNNSVSSYDKAAAFYKLIGFSSNTEIYFLIFLTFICYLLTGIIGLKFFDLNFLNLHYLLFIVMYSIFFGAYYNTFSKDLITSIYMIVPFFFYKTSYFKYALGTVIMVYGITQRSYWLLVLLVFVCLNIFFKKKRNIYELVLFFLTISIVISIGYYVATKQYISSAKLDVIQNLSGNTVNQNIIPNTNILADYVNNLYSLGNLILPLNGIQSFNEVIYYVWILTILNICRKKFYVNKSFQDITYLFTFFIAFVFIQSFFEPDTGSTLRHQVPLTIVIMSFYKK